MQSLIAFAPFKSVTSSRKVGLVLGLVILVMGLSVMQDYFYSKFRDTGFYLSESVLYNSIWMFVIPLAWLEIRLFNRISGVNKLQKILFWASLVILFTFLHVLIFAGFFASVSALLYNPSHRFLHMFNAALSNQFYVLAMCYTLAPLFSILGTKRRLKATLETLYPEVIQVKIGLKRVSLNVMDIDTIISEKPYSSITSKGKTFLDNRSLKEFESFMDPDRFTRVHRSVILNKRAIKELKSRKNGDYDALLKNGSSVRLSRHYRSSWEDLLH